MPVPSVIRCLVCGDRDIDIAVDDRLTTTSCSACGAVLVIEFDPPDEPALRARIERVDTADQARGRLSVRAS